MFNRKKIWVLFSYNLLDLLRDRRTLFMVVLLPVVLYPLLGIMMVQLLASKIVKPVRIGLIGVQQPGVAGPQRLESLPFFAPCATLPGAFFPGPAQGLEVLGPLLAQSLHPAPLFMDSGNRIYPSKTYSPRDAALLLSSWHIVDRSKFPTGDSKEAIEILLQEEFDCIIEFSDNLWSEYLAGGAPKVRLFTSQKETMRRVFSRNIREMLHSWQEQLRITRFLQRGIPPGFHRALQIEGEEDRATAAENVQDRMREPVKDLIPFLVVIWALVGALYPSVDLCAGEKERGTMETLLISAATRLEIVLGKFLAIWLYSITAAVINLVCIGFTVGFLSHWYLHLVPFKAEVAIWGFALLIPTSALFSALGLAIGIFARSTREGQYFLTPMVMVVMPLILLSFGDIRLGFATDLIPVTGLVILLQNFMTAKAINWTLFFHLAVVMGITSWYAWLALQFAVRQFNREEVLFREAELIHWPTLFKSIIPSRSLTPTAAIGILGFVFMLLATHLFPPLRAAQWGVDPGSAAAIPALIVSFFWLKEGRGNLGFNAPAVWSWPLALLFGFLLIPVTGWLLAASTDLKGLKEIVDQMGKRDLLPTASTGGLSLLGMVIIPVLAKEIAFRGFLINHLKTALGPVQAAFLAALLSAAVPLQLSRFPADLALAFPLGLLAVRMGSIWPGVLAHLVLILPGYLVIAFPEFTKGWHLDQITFGSNMGPWGIIASVSGICLAGICLALALPTKFTASYQKLKTEIQSGAAGD